VTKFEFDDVRTLNFFTRFEIRQMFQVFCCRMRIRGKILCVHQVWPKKTVLTPNWSYVGKEWCCTST